MNRNEYNGWTNYETWVVNLWMDNSEGDQTYWRERAEEVLAAAKSDTTFTREERAALDLMEIIKEQHEEYLPELEGFASDLLNAAMSEVNWHEIAKHLVDEVAQEAQP